MPDAFAERTPTVSPVMKMKSSRGILGNVCLWVSILVIYGLLGYRMYVLYSEGIWLDWTVGDILPDAVIWTVIGMRASILKTMVIWLLSQDVLLYMAAFPIILAVLDRWPGGNGREA
jgi:hypothetical protein